MNLPAAPWSWPCKAWQRKQRRVWLSTSRLEHSLGVAHLAWTTATKVAQSQAAELDWPQREQVSDIKVIQVAGEPAAKGFASSTVLPSFLR